MQQTTIARVVRWRGIGLHGGEPVVVEVQPAPANTGLVFALRGESDGSETLIPARWDAVHSTTRATTLAPVSSDETGAEGASTTRVATVEHLLAALHALGIHNARIEVCGGEIPALDGSAAPFAKRLRRAGLRMLGATRRALVVTRVHEIVAGDRWVRIAPGEGLSIEYSIDFPHPCIGRQTYVLAVLDRSTFESELAPARTFGFAHEVEALRAMGLGLGGDYANTLVLGEAGLLNAGGLRFPDEFVRHKVVDLLGDLALVGADLQAHITVEKGGHGLHHALVRALFEQPGLALMRESPGVDRERASRAQPG